MKTYTKTTTTEEPQLVISYYENTESPREWSNLGYFITKDSNYNSPDKNEVLKRIVANTGDIAKDQEEHIKLIKKEVEEQTDEKVIAIYPVVKYEHSGVSYSLGTNHGFDCSNNGFYIVTDKTAKEVGTAKKDFKRIIEGEIETYNQYANGNVYCFTLYDEDGELEDSCSGFYSIEAIREHLPKSWKNEDLNEYLQAE